MKVYELDDANLKIFLESVPETLIRDSFKKSKILKSKLKGFRAEKCDINRLINISIEVIKKNQAYEYERILNRFFEDHKKGYEESLEKYINNGYPQLYAKAQAIIDKYNEKMRPVFYMLADFNEQEKKMIEESIQMLSFLDNRYKQDNKISLLDDIKKQYGLIKKEIDESDNRINKKINAFTDTVSTIQKDYMHSCFDFDSKLEVITKNQSVLKDELHNIKNNKKEKEEYASLKQIEVLEERLLDLQKSLNNLNNFNDNNESEWNHLIYKTYNLSNSKIGVIDNSDDLDEVIYDLFGLSGNFKSLRAMVKELLFNQKPIITSRKNSRILSEKMSLIISAGQLYELTITDNDFLKDLEKFIIKIDKEATSVALIKGLLTKPSFLEAIDLIKHIDSKHKFIFEIGYPSQLRYLPSELLEDFIFFDGYLNECNEADDAFILNLKMNSIDDSKFKKIIKELDLTLEQSLYSDNYSGILGYGIIPFLHYNEGIEFDDILSKLTDSDIRRKCQEIVENEQ